MALELLAGPFNLDLNGTPAKFTHDPFWIDEFGLVGYCKPQGGSGSYGIAQIDGKVWPRNNDPSAFYNPDIAWDVAGDRAVAYLNGGLSTVYGHYDPRTGKWIDTLVSGGGAPWTLMSDRYLAAFDRKLYYHPLSYTGSSLLGSLEYTFVATGSVSYGYISPARLDGQVWVGYRDGSIFLYDHVTKTQVGYAMGIGMTCIGLWYSRTFDVFISLHTVDADTQSVRVWANEVRPTSVSVPEALTALQRGRISTIRTRVLGSLSEPVADLPVDWSLTGPGSLRTTQSMTDVDGYALVDYIAPADAAGGAPEITATVKF